MSEKVQRHATVPQQCNVALAKEYSLQLDDGMPSLFNRSRGLSGLPTSFRGAFSKALVNEYGSHSICDGETRLEKWTSFSNIVPAGVLLDKQEGEPPSGSQIGNRLPPSSLRKHLAKSDQLPQQKQGCQQRGPGRPDSQQPGKTGSEPTGSAAQRSQAPGTGAAACATSGGGDAPSTQAAAKKMFKFKVKLNGRVVSPSPAPETDADALVDSMCVLGQEQLLSPLPSHWARIVENTSLSSTAAVPQGHTTSRNPAHPGAEAGTAPAHSSLQPPGRDEGQAGGREEVPGRGGSAGEAELVGAESGKMDSPFADAGYQCIDEAGDGNVPADAARVAGAAASLLSPLPSAWGLVVEDVAAAQHVQRGGRPEEAGTRAEKASPNAQGALDGQQAAGKEQQRQQEQPIAAAAARPGKRSLGGNGSGEHRQQHPQEEGERGRSAGTVAEGVPPAPKRPRSASEEPCRAANLGRHGPAAAPTAAGTAFTLQKRGSSCEAPPTQPSTLPPTRPASACGAVPPAAAASRAAAPRRATSPPQHPPLAPADAHRVGTPGASPSVKAGRPMQQQQQQQAKHGPSDEDPPSPLGAAAAPLQTALQAAASHAAPTPSGGVQQLLDEGKRLKRFAEKRMQKGRHTHVSCTFLLSSALKFLAASGLMEQTPSKHSRDSVSSMFTQTAAMLEACAHSATRAEGPQLGTQVVALIAERLGAVARLRAVHCLRNELSRSAAAFRTAVESARGETFQRPSPTDSSVSATVSIPLDGGSPHPGGSGGKGHKRALGGGSATTSPSGRGGASSSKKGRADEGAPAGPGSSAATGGGQYLGLPRGVVDRELGMAHHMQGVMAALSALSRSSTRVRDYMAKAAAEGNVHALRAAAGAALLSADAGMGDMEPVLQLGREALDAAMKIEG